MNNQPRLHRALDAMKGQSLVETALFLPILFLLLAGGLEVSNLLVTQNRVQTAARAGTGFGATNYDPTIVITDTFTAMSMVALNNVTQTVELEPERWDIYTVKATVNEAGDDFTEWVWQHPYGTEAVYDETLWEASEEQTQQDVLDAFEEDNAAGLELIATVAYHDRRSLLGLGFFDPGLTRIRGLTVMRISRTAGTNDGCDLFPIALHIENFSLYPENFAGSMVTGGKSYNSADYAGGGQKNIIPNHAYNDDPYDHSGFPLAEGGHRLIPWGPEPNRGDLFEMRQFYGPGGFGWLSWDGSVDVGALTASLTPPGNLSLVYPAPTGYVNYVNPDDANDYIPSIGDWVQGSTGNMNSNHVLTQVDDHIDSGRQVQVLVFDTSRAQGAGFDYRIAGFAQVYIRGRNTGGSDKFLLAEFIKWAEPCYALTP